jgi:hypothetical protein
MDTSLRKLILSPIMVCLDGAGSLTPLNERLHGFIREASHLVCFVIAANIKYRGLRNEFIDNGRIPAVPYKRPMTNWRVRQLE